jgi:ABC-type transport system substrate-binding protein
MYGYDAQPDSPFNLYDPERAKTVLAEAGYPGGRKPDGTQLTVTLDLQSSDPQLKQLGRAIAIDLAAIGIALEVRPNTWPDYLRRMNEGRFQMADSGWNLDYPDPENFLQLLYGPNRPPKSNSASYWNLEYDQLYEQMRDMPDSPERMTIIRRMVELVQNDLPWLPGHSRVSFTLVHSWRKNLKPHNISGGYSKYANIDVAQRAALREAWNRPNYWPLAVAGCGAVLAIVILTRLRTRVVV